MGASNRPGYAIACFLAFTAPALAGSASPTPEQLHQTLEIAVDMINKQLPRAIDYNTVLRATATNFDNIMIYHFEIKNPEDMPDIAEQRVMLENGYCTAPDFAVLRKLRVPVRWDYYTKDSRFIRTVTTLPDRCDR